MFETFSKKTPKFIEETLNACFNEIKQHKSEFRDRKSREWLEKLKWEEELFKKELEFLKDYYSVCLEEIVINEKQYDYLSLQNKIQSLLFMIMKLKNERIKLSNSANIALVLLNNNLCL